MDDYFNGLDVSARAAFEHIRKIAMDLVPDAEEGTSYGMAAPKYKQKPALLTHPWVVFWAADE